MNYAIIPLAAITEVQLPYKVISQIFIGEANPTKLSFLLLEDRFTSEQMDEITSLDGILFNEPTDYFDWLENQNEAI